MTENATRGTSIEKYRAKARNADHSPAEWFDVIMPDLTPIEVKSTEKRINTDPELVSKPRNGRFRLWKNQHSRMVEQGGEYDFVVVEDDGTHLERTLSADEVSALIDKHDLSFTGAGGHSMGQQVKIPWPYVRDF